MGSRTTTISVKQDKMRSHFKDFVVGKDHPCVMAQSVFIQDKDEFHVYKEFGSARAARKILSDLKSYLESYDFDSNEFYSFIAAFEDEPPMDEKQFEKKLWQQLQKIHEMDEVEWDPEVSPNPQDDNFSFSIMGKAFYLVGMHPGSSRKARQAPFPVMVFNLHWQFEKLRQMGAYTNVRDKIRERDMELQGNINPMLQDFGEKSEAAQYSGRAVEEEWKCPFHRKEK